VVTAAQIEHFKTQGYVVVPGILDGMELAEVRAGLHASVESWGVDLKDLDGTAHHLRQIHVVGGIIEQFFNAWKMKALQNERMYKAICQLYGATYASGKERGFETPIGSFDSAKTLLYIDRFGFRLPSEISAKHVKNRRPLQTGLGPHVDCNPYHMYTMRDQEGHRKYRWRPIQSFLALTPNEGKDQGGFECVPGFHLKFEKYFNGFDEKQLRRPPTSCEFMPLDGPLHEEPCAGFKCDIVVPAGAAVFWDWRIPHKNAAIHNGERPREVVYTGYLPDIPLNREYVREQLQRYKRHLIPQDFARDGDKVEALEETAEAVEFSALGLQLMGHTLPAASRDVGA